MPQHFEHPRPHRRRAAPGPPRGRRGCLPHRAELPHPHRRRASSGPPRGRRGCVPRHSEHPHPCHQRAAPEPPRGGGISPYTSSHCSVKTINHIRNISLGPNTAWTAAFWTKICFAGNIVSTFRTRDKSHEVSFPTVSTLIIYQPSICPPKAFKRREGHHDDHA